MKKFVQAERHRHSGAGRNPGVGLWATCNDCLRRGTLDSCFRRNDGGDGRPSRGRAFRFSTSPPRAVTRTAPTIPAMPGGALPGRGNHCGCPIRSDEDRNALPCMTAVCLHASPPGQYNVPYLKGTPALRSFLWACDITLETMPEALLKALKDRKSLLYERSTL